MGILNFLFKRTSITRKKTGKSIEPYKSNEIINHSTEEIEDASVQKQSGHDKDRFNSAYRSELFPDFPLNPQDLFVLGETIEGLSLLNIARIGLCVTDEFKALRDSAKENEWPAYADRELSALINAYNQMQAKVPSHIKHTVNVDEVRQLAAAYIEKFKNDKELYAKFMSSQITIMNLSIDFGNTIACGGTLQTILSWYG